MNENKNPTTLPFGDGLIIGVASVCSYAFAFVWEAGHVHVYGLPIWLIQINLTTVFVACAGLLFLLNAVTQVAVSTTPRFFYSCFVLTRALVFGLGFLFIAFLTARYWPSDRFWTGALVFLIVFGIGIVSAYLWLLQPIRTRKPGERWIDALAREDSRFESSRAGSIVGSISERLKQRGVDFRLLWNVALSYQVFLYLVFQLGKLDAKAQSVFLVSASDSTAVLLRTYSDKSIIAFLDSSRAATVPRYRVATSAEVAATSWRIVQLGKLRFSSQESVSKDMVRRLNKRSGSADSAAHR